MVWSVGMGRMKAFARLLEAGSFARNVPPNDVKKQKLAVADILRELGDANEPNLLDEKDMHVFGLTPMDDPLHLVLCNFCKKTINASQYVSHAELCKYLGFQKACVEADDRSVHKKTTRKRRNKVSRCPPGKPALLEPTRVDHSVGSKSHQEDPIGTVSSLSTLTDDSLDGMPKLDVSSLNFGIEDFSTSTASRLKRSKLKDAVIIVKPDERESMDAKCRGSQEEQTCRGSCGAAVRENGKPDKRPLDHQTSKKYPNCSLPYDEPVPLATKMYYSQRSSHLRSALSLMFREASEIRSSCDAVLEGNLTSPETCPILDELGTAFSRPKEPVHQTMVSGPSSGFRTAADLRTTTTTVSGLNVNNLFRPYIAASVDMLNR